MSVAIMTDTNSGIRVGEGQEMGVAVLPMPILVDGDTYYEDVNLSAPDFYRFLKEGRAVSTSQPAPSDVLDMWDSLLERFDEVVYIPMSSGLSSSCQTALTFARDYNGKVQVADNRRISVTQRFSVMDALALRNAGCSAFIARLSFADFDGRPSGHSDV